MEFEAKNIHEHKNNEGIQNSGQNMQCETFFLEESLDLLFSYSASLT